MTINYNHDRKSERKETTIQGQHSHQCYPIEAKIKHRLKSEHRPQGQRGDLQVVYDACDQHSTVQGSERNCYLRRIMRIEGRRRCLEGRD